MAKRGPKTKLPQEAGAVRRVNVRMPTEWANALRTTAGGTRKVAVWLRAIVDGALARGELPAAVEIPEDAPVDIVTVRLLAGQHAALVDLAGGERLVAGRLRGLILSEVNNVQKT